MIKFAKFKSLFFVVVFLQTHKKVWKIIERLKDYFSNLQQFLLFHGTRLCIRVTLSLCSCYLGIGLRWFWHKPIFSDRFQSQIVFICSFSLVLQFSHAVWKFWSLPPFSLSCLSFLFETKWKSVHLGPNMSSFLK